MRDSTTFWQRLRRLATFAGLASAMLAQTVTTYSTGMSSPSGAPPVPTPGGSVSLYGWALDTQPGRAYAFGGTLPLGWAANTGTSAWVTPQANSLLDQTPGYYYFETHFSLAGLNLSTVNIQFQVAAPCGAFFSVNWNSQPNPPCGVGFSGMYTIPAAQLQQNDNFIQVRVPATSAGQVGLHLKVIAANAGSTQIGLYSTGVNDSRVVLAAGAGDTHWKIVTRPPSVSIDNSGIWSYWLANSASTKSKWISPEPDGIKALPPGQYVYSHTLNLPSFNPATQIATITGSWAADDGGVIAVNYADQPLTQLPGGWTAFQALKPFSIADAPLVAGWNSVQFKVTNGGSADNATGLRVDDFKVTITPRGTSGCTATQTQIENRTKSVSIPILPITTGPGGVTAGVPTGMGQTYCDPVFGTQVVRVTDNIAPSYQMSPLQNLAFNKDSTKIAVLTNTSGLRVFDFDPVTMAVSGGKDISVSPQPAAFYTNSDAIVWSGGSSSGANKTIIFANGMKLYTVDVTTPTQTLTLLADLSSEAPAGSRMTRLTNSRWATDGSVMFSAVIDLPVKSSGGYVAFKVPSMTPATPATNYVVRAKVLNPDATTEAFKTIARVSPVDGKTYTVRLYSPYSGGYKMSIDKTGRYVKHGAMYVVGGAMTLNMNAEVIEDLDQPVTDPLRFKAMLYGGHATLGDGVAYGHNTQGLAPDGSCILCRKKWAFADLSTDLMACAQPGGVEPVPSMYCNSPSFSNANLGNSGTALTAPAYWGADGDYTTYPLLGGNSVGFYFGCINKNCATSSHPPFEGELVVSQTSKINPLDVAAPFKRIVHSRHADSVNYWGLEPNYSPDGQFIAFTSNMAWPNSGGSARTDIFVVRVP